ncbi:unnamed protein product [Parnassius mnemosyne]|uniref:DDE Tnp4 domain-containing protein n=1 Tax=Parnassius mnemosyne TaxID=213953 RepID=A0AAV1MCH0_9NEOP
MRPYPGNQDISNEEKKIFNYRLRRARRVCKNAFGILARRFRIYQRRLSLTPEHVNIVVAATVALHNFLRNSKTYCSEEDLRENVNHGLVDLFQIGGNASQAVFEIREKFKTYFLSNAGSVPWQTNIVRRGFQHHSL